MKEKKIEIAPFGAITNERPKGMDFETYKRERNNQNKRLKKRLKSGFKID